MAKEEVVLHRLPPQVEPAMAQADFFAWQFDRTRLEDRCLSLAEDGQLLTGELDAPVAILGLTVPSGRRDTLPVT